VYGLSVKEETSLGYYINPLVSVLLGIFFLKERLSLWQLFAFFLAIVGVLSLTLQYGDFPWVALTLALSFGVYGLFKKVINIGSITGLTLETLVTCVFALAYLGYVYNTGNGAFKLSLSPTTLLLIGAGAVTATPLILFAAGTRRLPLFVIGFLQYISPTMGLLLGIFIYHEPFTRGHLISFAVIWAGLIVFSLSRIPLLVGIEEKIMKQIRE
jgi:chloramphenicol-sensitive protein RarD